MNFMPDDDDTLTVIKGTNITGNPGTSDFGPDTTFYSEEAGVTTLKYKLNEREGEITIPLPTELGQTTSGSFDGFQDNYGPFYMTRAL